MNTTVNFLTNHTTRHGKPHPDRKGKKYAVNADTMYDFLREFCCLFRLKGCMDWEREKKQRVWDYTH